MSSAVTEGGSLRDQQRAFTRERLLQGAAEVFAEKGYVSATIDDIVSAAGASRATFYLHFRTKGELIRVLGGRLFPQVRKFYGELDGALAEGSREAMKDWMSRTIAWMEENRAVMTALDAAQFIEGPLANEQVMRLADDMPRYLARWPEDMRHQARTKIALLAVQFRAAFSFLLDTEQVRNELSDDELVEVMTDVWLAGLQPPEPRR